MVKSGEIATIGITNVKFACIKAVLRNIIAIPIVTPAKANQ